MAALVRAGLPLEEGLAQIEEEFGGRPGDLASRLTDDMAAGRSLGEAIAAQGNALPASYRAIVTAGLRAERLPAALEGYADMAERIAELRRIAAQAGAY